MQQNGIILSFGGGGFTHDTDPELEDICLGLLPENPALGYVGWANNDDETRIARFYQRFQGVAGSLSHLPKHSGAAETQDWLAGKDMVYFAGGNTAHLIDRLIATDAHTAFRAANKNGCVLAGVSAGGVCWFDWVLSDAGGQGYQPLRGLSFVHGGVCPHYTSEPGRAPLFSRAAAKLTDSAAFAIDDGAGIVCVDGVVQGYVCARQNSAAYRLTGAAGAMCATPLPPFNWDAHRPGR